MPTAPRGDAFASRDWVRAWHGTKARHLRSIIDNGLRPAGSSAVSLSSAATSSPLVEIPEGHIPMGVTVGIDDWARAVFVSPSISYSCHGAYAERILGATEDDGRHRMWCVVLDVAVRRGDFTSHPSTVVTYVPLRREPEDPEMRVSGRSTARSSTLPDDAVVVSEPGGELDETGAATDGVEILRVGAAVTQAGESSFRAHASTSATAPTPLHPINVMAVLFVRLDFIETARAILSYAEVQALLQTPPTSGDKEETKPSLTWRLSTCAAA